MVWTGVMCALPNGDAPRQCSSGDVADCTKQCDKGHNGSCATLGLMLTYGSNKDPKRAREVLDKACKGREGRACDVLARTVLAERVQAKDDAGKAALTAEGQKLLDVACDYGDAPSCHNTASFYLWGADGFAKNPTKALAMEKRACDLGNAYACLSTANLLLSGQAGTKDPVVAGALLTRACDSWSFAHCQRLAEAHQRGELGSPDAGKAIEAYDRACTLGGAYACAAAGKILKMGDGVPADVKRATEFLSRGCTEKIRGWDACRALGEVLEATDKAKAAEVYERGCMLGSCARAAALYEKGDGVKADTEKAIALYTKGCQTAGDTWSCEKVGQLLEKKDKSAAKDHYLKYCTERFDQPMCDAAKKLGATIPANVKPHPRFGTWNATTSVFAKPDASKAPPASASVKAPPVTTAPKSPPPPPKK